MMRLNNDEDNILKGFLMKENVYILIKIPLKYVPESKSSSVQIMACHPFGTKAPLPPPILNDCHFLKNM